VKTEALFDDFLLVGNQLSLGAFPSIPLMAPRCGTVDPRERQELPEDIRFLSISSSRTAGIVWLLDRQVSFTKKKIDERFLKERMKGVHHDLSFL
jgi:hypothetical protein